ncbi:AraC family transcriptional regulator [Burkholderia sp. Ac-20353]|uniref:AraC family transcriptional regulator n=1 Tax=Burkholderia sp. Ac-20353 TaxID=2703894 RepID=UPI00197C8160|nr:AraC family transcriptional regulator [Burkholderia sp. Ac-20353]MBN3786360.1 AraC family transcriptional regulator [Burkholderia sp. Ac-20353]
MPLYQAFIPTRYSQPLIQLLARSEEKFVEQIQSDTGLNLEQLCSPDSILTIDEFDTLFLALHRLTGRTDLGFELGESITLASHGLLGHAAAHCRTIGEVLSLGVRFARLMSPSFTLVYRTGKNHGELIWRPAAGMSTFTLHAFYEIHVVSLYRLLEALMGSRLPVFDGWLPIPKPPHARRFSRLPKLRVHFSAGDLPEVRTTIPDAVSLFPLRLEDTNTLPSLDELQNMQRSFTQTRQWRTWVELMLRECENCQPTQAELADLINVSAHTLARRLREEGCSFRELSGTIRHQRALEMLSQGRYSIEQIAGRLGYEQVSNFSHAFSKIEGISPRTAKDALHR